MSRRTVPLRVTAGKAVVCTWCGGTSIWIMEPEDNPDAPQIHCYNQECWDNGVSELEEYEVRKNTFRMITSPQSHIKERLRDCD